MRKLIIINFEHELHPGLGLETSNKEIRVRREFLLLILTPSEVGVQSLYFLGFAYSPSLGDFQLVSKLGTSLESYNSK